MATRSDQAKIAVLKALHDLDEPAGASRITDALLSSGVGIQPRTVRFYLLQLDREGLTRQVSRRRGRQITERGLHELAHANVMEKVGFVAAKVDNLSYRMRFDARTGKGTIITNTAVIASRDVSRALGEMQAVFSKHLGMGTRLRMARQGEIVGGIEVPVNSVGIATFCSVTFNGILLAAGIPVTSRFGGLVEIRDGRPVRFVELIEYSGTTLDPLEAFIRAGMTSVRECAQTGSGLIGASFREVPVASIEDVRRIHSTMEGEGLGGLLVIGRPNQPLLDVPVAEGRTGIVVLGGLNPIAAVHEAGIDVSLASLAGLEDVETFLTFKEVYRRY
ncbi:MAG: DUF128 domain-containing protein, partial [Phycisphaerae bacterium]|nr:DUF128 domain-containing protein [Phycisphaerae bacterium]